MDKSKLHDKQYLAGEIVVVAYRSKPQTRQEIADYVHATSEAFIDSIMKEMQPYWGENPKRLIVSPEEAVRVH